MAYKRQSPTPIAESGINYISQTDTNGTIIFDGTGLSTINPGTSGSVLTSMGSAAAPSFEPLAGSGSSWIGSAGGTNAQISINNGLGGAFYNSSINASAAVPAAAPTENLFIFPFACIISNLYVVVTNNTASNTINSFINVNGSNSSVTVSIPAGTNGVFTDLVHTIAVSSGDKMALTSNATGSMGQLVNGQWTIQITP